MPDGSLLFVKMLAREVWRRFPDGRLERHADLSAIAVHRANDMVVDGTGRAYVGNFGFDLDHEITTRGAQAVLAEHATTALAIVEPDGHVARGPDGLGFPNGMVLTADGWDAYRGRNLRPAPDRVHGGGGRWSVRTA